MSGLAPILRSLLARAEPAVVVSVISRLVHVTGPLLLSTSLSVAFSRKDFAYLSRSVEEPYKVQLKKS